MSSGTALLHLIFLFLMVGLLVGGTVGLLMLWYLRGRDPAVGRIAEYIETPPDDLPPGAAGTLLDEHADHSDVVATLLGLGRNGAVTIEELGVERDETSRRAGRDYRLTVVDATQVQSRVERDLLATLIPDPQPGATVLLSETRDRFRAAEPKIRDDLYQEMVDRGYFTVSPAVTRKRWHRGAIVGLVLSVIVGLFLAIQVDAWALFATFGAVVLFFALMRMSRVMPQKTRDGAESSAKWKAFRRYLESIDKRRDLSEATDLFDRYFAYAVAFGLEKQWICSFAKVGAQSPGWFNQGGTARGGGVGDVGESMWDAISMAHMMGHLTGRGGGDMSNVDLPNVGMPDIGGLPDLGNIPNVDLQGMSDLMGGGLQGASDGLGGLLDSAGGIFDSIDFDFFN